MQTGLATVENSVEDPQKIKNETALWLSSSTSGNISEETQSTNSKEYIHPCVHCSVIYTIANVWKQPKFSSVDEWIKHLWYIYIIEYYLIIKKKKNLPFVTVWVGLENIMLSATSQSEKEIRISFHSYVESKEQGEVTSKIETDS